MSKEKKKAKKLSTLNRRLQISRFHNIQGPCLCCTSTGILFRVSNLYFEQHSRPYNVVKFGRYSKLHSFYFTISVVFQNSNLTSYILKIIFHYFITCRELLATLNLDTS